MNFSWPSFAPCLLRCFLHVPKQGKVSIIFVVVRHQNPPAENICGHSTNSLQHRLFCSSFLTTIESFQKVDVCKNMSFLTWYSVSSTISTILHFFWYRLISNVVLDPCKFSYVKFTDPKLSVASRNLQTNRRTTRMFLVLWEINDFQISLSVYFDFSSIFALHSNTAKKGSWPSKRIRFRHTQPLQRFTAN